MQARIVLTNLETGQKVAAFPPARSGDLFAIVHEMNRLNEEAARLTGTMVKFVYTIALKG